jgi:hypothetical protein
MPKLDAAATFGMTRTLHLQGVASTFPLTGLGGMAKVILEDVSARGSRLATAGKMKRRVEDS